LEEIMANSAPGEAHDFNTKIIEEFRANEGRVGGPIAGTMMIPIHRIGAKSGIERVSPMACSPQGDGRFAIVASNGGSPTHPDWYYNLKTSPRIKVHGQKQRTGFRRADLEFPGEHTDRRRSPQSAFPEGQLAGLWPWLGRCRVPREQDSPRGR
jgi:deazaflavin-dependent oxidoreductase (nitroreductase family)